jgi:hypothetical protein
MLGIVDSLAENYRNGIMAVSFRSFFVVINHGSLTSQFLRSSGQFQKYRKNLN